MVGVTAVAVLILVGMAVVAGMQAKRLRKAATRRLWEAEREALRRRAEEVARAVDKRRGLEGVVLVRLAAAEEIVNPLGTGEWRELCEALRELRVYLLWHPEARAGELVGERKAEELAQCFLERVEMRRL